MYDIFYVSKGKGNDNDWMRIKSKYPLAHRLSNITSFEDIKSKSFTKMFWVVWDDIELTSFNLLEYKATKWDDMYVHVFKNGEHYDGICLFPKSLTVSHREFNNRFFTEKKEIDVVASIPKGYDKFYFNTYDEYLEAVQQSTTDMFWAIWPDVVVDNNFKFDYKVPVHNSHIVHIFKNGEHYDGICLFPKNSLVSKREFHHRFFTEKKEIDIVASTPKQYNIYPLSTYEEYQTITDEMFWLVSPEVKIINNTIFDLYFSHHNSYDRRENHVFKILCNGEELYLTGVILCSKYKQLTNNEFERQYAIDKKEHDIVVGKFQYPVYTINSYNEYLDLAKTKKMFWCVWPGIEILNDNLFDLYFKPNDATLDYDREENHVFKNVCNDIESYLSGVVLFSNKKIISEKEFRRRYLIDKKEYNKVASRYRYNKYVLSSYDEYLEISNSETQPLFWGIWPEIEITNTKIFDLYYDPNDGKYDHDRKENHTFKHLFNDKEISTNGLVLFSKEKTISHREFIHRFLIEKKEHTDVVSEHKLYDIVFISYNELNADENYKKLINKFPRAKRVHGVKGIHQAHIKAASMCNTDMIWVVDGDADIEEDFNFNLVMSSYDIDCVHVWRSRNPINNLEYGNGGVKLLPRQLTLDMDVNTSDMTTSISKKFKAMNTVSNANAFNTDEFTTWRSAFRECCKLSSRTIERQFEEETQQRLDIWCTEGHDAQFGEYAIAGAKAGRQYGLENKNNLEELRKINDFDWLKEQFDASK
jgi:hypothetical protein